MKTLIPLMGLLLMTGFVSEPAFAGKQCKKDVKTDNQCVRSKSGKSKECKKDDVQKDAKANPADPTETK